MKKKRLFIISIIIIVLLICIALFICFKTKKVEKSKTYDGTITSMNFYYAVANSVFYKFEIAGPKERRILTFTEQKANGRTSKYRKRLTPKNLKEIKDTINSNKIYEWNGFDKGVKGSKTKNNFILEVSYSDSKTLTAYGNKEYPVKFDERKKALYDCLERIVSSYR